MSPSVLRIIDREKESPRIVARTKSLEDLSLKKSKLKSLKRAMKFTKIPLQS
jgi:hypothetical protein